MTRSRNKLRGELSNIEMISEEMFANYHQMQYFINESNWQRIEARNTAKEKEKEAVLL